MHYVSLHAVLNTLREKRWGFCAALSTPMPVVYGPNLRLLYRLQRAPVPEQC